MIHRLRATLEVLEAEEEREQQQTAKRQRKIALKARMRELGLTATFGAGRGLTPEERQRRKAEMRALMRDLGLVALK